MAFLAMGFRPFRPTGLPRNPGCNPFVDRGHAKHQSFKAYRQSRPARQTSRRRAIYLSRVGELTAAQQLIVTATAEFH